MPRTPPSSRAPERKDGVYMIIKTRLGLGILRTKSGGRYKIKEQKKNNAGYILKTEREN